MNDQQAFTKVTTEDHNEYFCPLEIASDHQKLSPEALIDCVEAEVVGRYIGSIDVVAAQ